MTNEQKERKEIFTKTNSIIIFLIGVTIVNGIIFSVLTNQETQQPKPLPQNMLTPIPNQFEVLDKMSCMDIMTLTDGMLKSGNYKFTNDMNENSYKAYALDLRNQCLQSVSPYEMIIDSAGNHKYLVNGKWIPLEMTHN